jgi:hypothetical protein
MRVKSTSPLVILTMMMGGVWSGCGSEPGSPFRNEAPNTRISAAPPEMNDTSYAVNINWFGWDDDGFVSHYEIAWETPDNWSDPIFANDSLFTVAASGSCCVPPLPEHGITPPDSIYEQFHTFYVRSVDNDGEPDPIPAHRSFNAKTIAPCTEIDFGPQQGSFWSPNVKITWTGYDDDGLVEGFEYAFSSVREFVEDGYTDLGQVADYIAWIDTLTYRPLPAGEKGPNPWTFTTVDSVELLIPEDPGQFESIFAVRSIDNAGAEERVLDPHIGFRPPSSPPCQGNAGNVAVFRIRTSLAGPTIALRSNVAGSKRSGEAEDVREVFAGEGLQFSWTGRPGQSQAAVAGYSFAVDDTSEWTPFSLNDTEYPEQVDPEVEEFWFPETGDHAFFVRAIDFAGFVNVLAMKLKIFNGPTFCDAVSRYILVVLDTDADQLQQTLVLPTSYEAAERGLVEYLFEEYNYVLYESEGEIGPDVSLLNCASSVFWFMTSDIDAGDASVLNSYHVQPPNVLSSYVNADGNLFLCGVQPTNATRFFDDPTSSVPVEQNYPVIFSRTLTDTTFVPHWATTVLRIDRVEETVPSTLNATGEDAAKRLSRAVSHVEGFPDLEFDPLTWPQGPLERGCGLYDRGVIPMSDAQTLYTANEASGPPIALRKHVRPGVAGNVVYLGFHPYFFHRPQVRELIRAVLDDFGEVKTL